MSLFGTSGIRRVFGGDLVRLAYRLGLAVGRIYGEVVVARDTRTSGPVLQSSLLAGLLAGGAAAYDIGIAPTPTLALAARKFRAGVMITASHNPPEYNGLKLVNPDGSAFHEAQRREIERAVAGELAAVPWHGLREPRCLTGALEAHMARVMADFPSGSSLKVVVDGGCGAAHYITPTLLTRLGCRVTSLNCHPSGYFPRGIEPVDSNLQDLMVATKELGAAVGIAHDGDADRMMAVDDRGRFIPGDKLLLLLAQSAGGRRVITTVDASMGMEEAGFEVTRTQVGDVAVSEQLSHGGDFGGEPSGSWVFPRLSLCPDGIYAAARMVAIASRTRLSDLVDSLPGYPMRRGSLIGPELAMSRVGTALADLNPRRVSTLDGLKLIFDDGWLLVRPSGTEPKIRLTVEARTEARMEELYEAALVRLKGCQPTDKEVIISGTI